MDTDFQVTQTFNQMFYQGWNDKIPTSNWPKFITRSKIEQVQRNQGNHIEK